MIFHKTNFEGLYAIVLKPHKDERGYLTRTFCQNEFVSAGIEFSIVQSSQSFTEQKGTLRGLHIQSKPKEEKKIIMCVKGAVYDVALDLRKESATYGKWFSQELNEKNNTMVFIPEGFAHGFQTLTAHCIVQYMMSEFYTPELTGGVRYDDPILQIPWPIHHPLLSQKDNALPLMKNYHAT